MRCRVCGTELPEGALFCGECGSAVMTAQADRDDPTGRGGGDTSIVRAAGGSDVRLDAAHPHPADSDSAPAEHEIPAPAEPEPRPDPEPPSLRAPDPRPSFTLVFPSGGREGIVGSGLLGRRPIAQPAETFDQYVVVNDPERTISKTHLQFGIDNDEFWVCDRYSANGTVVVSPRGTVRPCEPGRRYRAPRGSRVEIGESYFDVE